MGSTAQQKEKTILFMHVIVIIFFPFSLYILEGCFVLLRLSIHVNFREKPAGTPKFQ